MAAALDPRECFVIMPFGEKTTVDGVTVKFDDIYTYFLAKAIADAGLVPVRCDEVAEAGLIHRRMLEHIRDAKVAVADISLSNANVYYEIGVRHTLRKAVTVLVRRKGTTVPFNIANLNVIEYDETDLASVAEASAKITEFIRNGLRSQRTDSLVHDLLDLAVSVPARRLTRQSVHDFRVQKHATSVGVVTGGLDKITDVDVWVNAENTNMQMARFYDWSISSVIRYLGARRDVTGHVEEAADDLIANELSALMGSKLSVPPGTVIPTGPGELRGTHNVKKIFHAAAVQGAVGEGYRPIGNVAGCVTRALQLMDAPEFAADDLRSIVFPLLGAGVAPRQMPEIVDSLIETALSYVLNTPATRVDRIRFLAWSDGELDACLTALARHPELKRRT